MIILGIETSCDETSAALVRDGRVILSNVIHTQEVHHKFGGVVPEVASRNHVIKIFEVLDAVEKEAGMSLREADAIAVTRGPGLVGALLIGVNTAKGLAYSWQKPLIPVHHVEAHLYANMLHFGEIPFPFLGLIVSGGHTHLVLVESPRSYRLIGQTRDDAVGEAFDKVAKMLGLGYPGGPAVDRIAAQGDEDAMELPIPVLRDNPMDFSFSGLKTAVRNLIARSPGVKKEDVCASFQKTAVRALTQRVELFFTGEKPYPLVVAGGVAANSRLRAEFSSLSARYNVPLFIPPVGLCTDNAAMVAALGNDLFREGAFLEGEKLLSLNATSSLSFV
ncbi:tRNA (adenosine(37)-N6)-threonylcarbamoyltransferase complex transferase subunit TsaD [Candidatus Mcinerneyibacteriota bacterium]|nr:tRNA (adenosine(37)-N6)-threonylcarbamoyltransferase complex transferase subunit TsaD [Candidatus Mcinerneyibacteriota bacterium]